MSLLDLCKDDCALLCSVEIWLLLGRMSCHGTLLAEQQISRAGDAYWQEWRPAHMSFIVPATSRRFTNVCDIMSSTGGGAYVLHTAMQTQVLCEANITEDGMHTHVSSLTT